MVILRDCHSRVAGPEEEMDAHNSDVPTEWPHKVPRLPSDCSSDSLAEVSEVRTFRAAARCGRGPLTGAGSPIGRQTAVLKVPPSPGFSSYACLGLPRFPHQTTPARPSLMTRAAACTQPFAPKDTLPSEHGLFETMEGLYTELWQVAECGNPDSMVMYDRSEEIDLSHEFPPEPREAQVDPQAAFHRPIRLDLGDSIQA
ncbi:unnamed protein product [Effrenium voratum]|nr:unnamed protein product [Effrenium voratum]